MSLPKVLLVEDDVQISKVLKISLSVGGFDVTTAESLSEARTKLKAATPELLLLDINLPDGNGLEFCRELRSAGVEIPVLFLSARADEETIVKAMNIGAEDYVRKPFGVEELKARMGRILKRTGATRDTLSAGSLTVDIGRRTASAAGNSISLPRREFDILVMLMKKPGEVVSREGILSSIADGGEMFDRTIDSHISHLRRKIRDASQDAVQIVSVYGVGYKLNWNG